MLAEAIVHTDYGQRAHVPGKCGSGMNIDVKYLGASSIRMLGARTGSVYCFSATEPVQPVDLRDANFLLACNLFTIA